jgi:hypothetical protein
MKPELIELICSVVWAGRSRSRPVSQIEDDVWRAVKQHYGRRSPAKYMGLCGLVQEIMGGFPWPSGAPPTDATAAYQSKWLRRTERVARIAAGAERRRDFWLMQRCAFAAAHIWQHYFPDSYVGAVMANCILRNTAKPPPESPFVRSLPARVGVRRPSQPGVVEMARVGRLTYPHGVQTRASRCPDQGVTLQLPCGVSPPGFVSFKSLIFLVGAA